MAVEKGNLKSRYIGGMIGSALGDAIGELAFRYRKKKPLCDCLDRLERLIYTDDTAMAIGLAESIIKVKGIDQNHLGETFRANYEREPWRGYAMGPPTIFSMVKGSGVSYVEAARALFGGAGSLGNGAAMRIVPLGLFFHKSSELYDMACASAEVTHAHPVGKDGAAVQARAVALAVRLGQEKEFPVEDFIQDLIKFAKTSEIRKKMVLVQEMVREDLPPHIAADRIGRSVEVDKSMPFAIYSFLRHPKSFKDCLFCAVLNGGDRDTLGAMACGISGAYLGIEAVPLSWKEKLENGFYIGKLASSLLEVQLVSMH